MFHTAKEASFFFYLKRVGVAPAISSGRKKFTLILLLLSTFFLFFIIIIGIEDFFPVGSQVSLRFGGRALYLYMNIIKKGGSGGILFAGGPSVFPMGDRLIAGIETGLSFMEEVLSP